MYEKVFLLKEMDILATQKGEVTKSIESELLHLVFEPHKVMVIPLANFPYLKRTAFPQVDAGRTGLFVKSATLAATQTINTIGEQNQTTTSYGGALPYASSLIGPTGIRPPARKLYNAIV